MTLQTGAPLTASDVKLLEKGDWLLVVEAGSYLLGRGLKDGGPAQVRSIDGPYIDVFGPTERSDNRPSRFTFLGRPDPSTGFIPWSGGENPLPGGRVNCVLGHGVVQTGESRNFEWDQHDWRVSPCGWRPASQPNAGEGA